MSHIKNMQAFEKLTGICTGLGGNYNPGQQNLQVNAMATLLNIAQQSWNEMKEAQKVYDNATNMRELGFQKIRKLSSSVFGMLKTCSTNPLLIADALNQKRKIWGSRISKRTPLVTEKPDANISMERPSYGRGYAVLAEYFDALVRIVASEPNYQPNECKLSLVNLQKTGHELFDLNKAVTDAEIKLEEARIKRNAIYYLASDNLVDTASTVKMYVRSVFGFQSQEHRQVQKLRFTKLSI
jgi:hypothetical protein